MTSYRIDPVDGRTLIARWPDLPIQGSATVGSFADTVTAMTVQRVLDAASRYRWHRMLQLWDEGVFTDARAGSDPIVSFSRSTLAGPEPGWLPRLATDVILGDSPMSQYLRERIDTSIPRQHHQPSPVDPHAWLFADRRPLGNLEALLWSEWQQRLPMQEIETLRTELDAELAATTGDWVGRGRQVAWYLNADLLVGEDTWEGDDSDVEVGDRGVRLLRELTGVAIELTSSRDRLRSDRLQVHTPGSVVGFWLEDYAWTYGWPEPRLSDTWRVSGKLAPALELTVGELASFIIEGIAVGEWPFGGVAPGERPSVIVTRDRSG